MKVIDTEKCRDDVDDAHILDTHLCAYAGFGQGGCHVCHSLNEIENKKIDLFQMK